ncbi:MAG: glycolate oxidase subunit GlcE [Pseudomonadales bacterium]
MELPGTPGHGRVREMTTPRDLTDELLEAVRRAKEGAVAVAIMGSGSKTFLTQDADTQSEGRLLSTAEHRGVIEYRPEELVLTARAGTGLKEIQQLLARENQMLPFDPPQFQGKGTLGGAVACGLTGPARPWRGSVRDAVLGVVMINGFAERVKFGGQVVKNVAGFDLARLQVGTFGSLGVLLDISVRVIPQAPVELTCELELDAAAALREMRRWARLPLPVTATCHMDGRLFVRLSGAESSVYAAGAAIGGVLSGEATIWDRLRDHELPLFRSGTAMTVRQPAPAAALEPGETLLEWGGARRWGVHGGDGSVDAADGLPQDARIFGAGYARSLYDRADPVSGRYQHRLKRAFDPDNLFNPEMCRADITA